MTTVAAALGAARAKLPASEARRLLAHVLKQPVTWLMTHDDAMLDEEALRGFASLVARRAGGEPVAYLVGYREFFGRDFMVSPAVLIPRPETELLVEVALAKVGAGGTATGTPGILDLGTGSGCVAITLALERPLAQVTGVDASGAALDVARGNAQRHDVQLRWLHGDWFDPIAGEGFDLIVGNPPYIADADPHLAAGDLRHEPPLALKSGADGLDAIRRIIACARKHLAPGGHLLLEHGYDQAVSVRELLVAAGLCDIEQIRDLAGIVRVSGGRSC